MRNFTVLLFTLLIFCNFQNVSAQFAYISPMPGSLYRNPTTNIILKNGDIIDPASLHSDLFTVAGSISGNHDVSVKLSTDQKTILVYPVTPFAEGERVTVTVTSGLKKRSGEIISGTSFEFQTHPHYTIQQEAERRAALRQIREDEFGAASATPTASKSLKKFPEFEITSTGQEYPGKVFFYNFKNAIPGDTTADFQFRSILESNGDSVYAEENNNVGIDFKINHNGYITFYDDIDSGWFMMDTFYNVIDTIYAGNGYKADNHDFQIFPDGHCFIIIYDPQIVDMSQYVPGGDTAATVTGAIVQELDKDRNVVFEWSTWDHFTIPDSYVSLSSSVVDLVHANSIEQDDDGNILLSSRHYSEITKIDLATGNMIWRWGGKNNQFTFIDDIVSSDEFFYQHDARHLANGHYSMFNNNNYHTKASNVKEYVLDPVNKTATLVWYFIHLPVNTFNINSNAMGDLQLLPNGHRFIDWGLLSQLNPAPYPSFTEVDSLGNVVWEFRFSGNEGYVSYRAFKFAWDRCAVPLATSLTTNNITTNSADLGWAVPSYASGFEIQYKEDSSPDWITIPATGDAYSLTGLKQQTLYDWRVLTVCSVFADSSDYTDTQQFTTLFDGIAPIAQTSFRLYPNPASDRIEVHYVMQRSNNAIFTLTNLLGETIISQRWIAKNGTNVASVPLTHIAAGTYMAILKTDDGEFRSRLVIR